MSVFTRPWYKEVMHWVMLRASNWYKFPNLGLICAIPLLDEFFLLLKDSPSNDMISVMYSDKTKSISFVSLDRSDQGKLVSLDPPSSAELKWS